MGGAHGQEEAEQGRGEMGEEEEGQPTRGPARAPWAQALASRGALAAAVSIARRAKEMARLAAGGRVLPPPRWPSARPQTSRAALRLGRGQRGQGPGRGRHGRRP